MKKKLLVVFLFLVLMTSACGTQAPMETASPTLTETQAATAIETPSATITPSEQASATPTPETPVPTNPPDCINSAAFVADVTISDNQ